VNKKVALLLCCTLGGVLGGALPVVSSCRAGDKSESRPRQPTPFWESFTSQFLYPEKETNDATAKLRLLQQGWADVLTNAADPFACRASYSIGTELYKRSAFDDARAKFEWSLERPETFPGDHLFGKQMIAECYKATRDFSSSIRVSEEIIGSTDGPATVRSMLQKEAAVRICDLSLASKTPSVDDRRTAESYFGFITTNQEGTNEVKPSANFVRKRMENLKQLGDFQKADSIGRDFLANNATDPFSPVLAMDLCTLTNGPGAWQDYERWVEYFQSKGVSNNAGIANLEYELMNAYTRAHKYKEAHEVGIVLLDFKEENGDPVPWGANERSSLLSMSINVANQLGNMDEVQKLKETLLTQYPNGPDAVMQRPNNAVIVIPKPVMEPGNGWKRATVLFVIALSTIIVALFAANRMRRNAL
jgi:hypothetical protein